MTSKMLERMAVVLHWWNDDCSIKPYLDTVNPVILSIACIRINNPYVAIYVIDVSDCSRPDSDWSYFPYKLDFKVIKVHSFLRELTSVFGKMYNIKLFSRVWDVELAMRSVWEHVIMFIDVDIFLIKPIVQVTKPLERFHSNKNNGIWLYDKRSVSSNIVFDTWKGMLCRAIHDDDFRRRIYQYNHNYGTYTMQDEIIYRTLLADMQNHLGPIEKLDNYLFYWLYRDEAAIVDAIRGLHCLSFITGKDRRKLFLVIKELWDQITRILDPADIKVIFQDALPEEMIRLGDFHKSPTAIDRFLNLVNVKDSCFKEMAIANENIRIQLL